MQILSTHSDRSNARKAGIRRFGGESVAPGLYFETFKTDAGFEVRTTEKGDEWLERRAIPADREAEEAGPADADHEGLSSDFGRDPISPEFASGSGEDDDEPEGLGEGGTMIGADEPEHEPEFTRTSAPSQPEPAPAPEKAKGERRKPKLEAMMEAARKGILPDLPDFSADTHKSYRPKLEKVQKMVEAGDLEGLKAHRAEMEAKSTSRIAICRYREAAITALEARA